MKFNTLFVTCLKALVRNPMRAALTLIFKISFLLLTLGFFVSSFSSCFRCRVRLFI